MKAEHEGRKPHPKLKLASSGFRDLFAEQRAEGAL